MTIEYIVKEEDAGKKIGFNLGWDSEYAKDYNLYWVLTEGWTELILEIRDMHSKEVTKVILDSVPLKVPYNIIAALEVLTKEVNEKYNKQIIDPFSRIRLESWYDGFNHLEEVLLDMGVDKELLDNALTRVVNEGWKPIR